MLERQHPQHFARAETQLTVNQGVSTGPTNVVVVGPERAKVLAARYEAIRTRSRELLDAREANTGNDQGSTKPPPQPDDALAEQYPTGSSNGAPAQEPLPVKPASWWRLFIFDGAVIPKPEATLAVRMILSELRITVDERALDFGTDNVVKSTFSNVLEQLSGSDLGWRTMVQIQDRIFHVPASCSADVMPAATAAGMEYLRELIPADMPANVRRFFQTEEPVVSPRQSESAQDWLECGSRESFGGWCG